MTNVYRVLLGLALHPGTTVIVTITKKFEVLDFAGLCWPSLAVLAFTAFDDFLKQKMANGNKN